jgi:hypothetical protein
MHQLIEFFIQQASIDSGYLAGMITAGIVTMSIAMIAAYQFLDLLVGWLKHFKPIKINNVKKMDKIVEVPTYVTNDVQYNEVLNKLNKIETALNKKGVEL